MPASMVLARRGPSGCSADGRIDPADAIARDDLSDAGGSPATTFASRCASTGSRRPGRRLLRPARAPRAGRPRSRSGAPTGSARDAAALGERVRRGGRRARPARLAGRPARRARGPGPGARRRRAGLPRRTSTPASTSARPNRRARSSPRRSRTSIACCRATGRSHERMAAWDARFTVPVERLRAVCDGLLPELRERARDLFGLPDGEALEVSLVRGQPWSGYNWYDGGLRSRVELNTDLPIRAADLLTVLPHETYPGHHLEHAWHEQHLVRDARPSRGEHPLHQHARVPPLGGPRRPRAAVRRPRRLTRSTCSSGHLPPGRSPRDPRPRDRTRRGRDAGRSSGALPPRSVASAATPRCCSTPTAPRAPRCSPISSAGSSPRPERAAKRLEFIEHPLWRTYVFVYFEGERLLARWLDCVPEAERPARFRRLLVEPLTPGRIVAEVAAGG